MRRLSFYTLPQVKNILDQALTIGMNHFVLKIAKNKRKYRLIEFDDIKF